MKSQLLILILWKTHERAKKMQNTAKNDKILRKIGLLRQI